VRFDRLDDPSRSLRFNGNNAFLWIEMFGQSQRHRIATLKNLRKHVYTVYYCGSHASANCTTGDGLRYGSARSKDGGLLKKD